MKLQRFIHPVALAAFFALVGAMGCGSGSSQDDEEEVFDPFNQPAPEPIANAAPLPPATSLVCPQGTGLTYDNFGESFFVNYCTMCHNSNLKDEAARGGAPLGADFDTPQAALVWRTAILVRATDGAATMPPSQNVPADIKALLAEWLNCGAPGGSAKLEQL